MATAITRLITLMRGEDVGTDGFGNRYYRDRRIPKYGRRRRWVVYNGEDEASRVPPEWHHWLPYTTDEVPPGAEAKRRPCPREHLPYMAGAGLTTRRPVHTLQGGVWGSEERR